MAQDMWAAPSEFTLVPEPTPAPPSEGNASETGNESSSLAFTFPAWVDQIDHLSLDQAKDVLAYAQKLLSSLYSKLPLHTDERHRMEIAAKALQQNKGGPSRASRKRKAHHEARDLSYRPRPPKRSKKDLSEPKVTPADESNDVAAPEAEDAHGAVQQRKETPAPPEPSAPGQAGGAEAEDIIHGAVQQRSGTPAPPEPSDPGPVGHDSNRVPDARDDCMDDDGDGEATSAQVEPTTAHTKPPTSASDVDRNLELDTGGGEWKDDTPPSSAAKRKRGTEGDEVVEDDDGYHTHGNTEDDGEPGDPTGWLSEEEEESNEMTTAGFSGSHLRLIARLVEDLTMWTKPKARDPDMVGAAKAILASESSMAIRSVVSGCSAAVMVSRMAHANQQRTESLFWERLGLMQVAAWFESEVDQDERRDPAQKRNVAQRRVLDRLIDAKGLSGGLARTERLRLNRDIRSGRRWMTLYEELGIGVLAIPHKDLGVTTLGDMKQATFEDQQVALFEDDALRSIIDNVTDFLKKLHGGADSDGSSSQLHIEHLQAIMAKWHDGGTTRGG